MSSAEYIRDLRDRRIMACHRFLADLKAIENPTDSILDRISKHEEWLNQEIAARDADYASLHLSETPQVAETIVSSPWDQLEFPETLELNELLERISSPAVVLTKPTTDRPRRRAKQKLKKRPKKRRNQLQQPRPGF